MSTVKWRFPGNNFTTESGLDTADMETFKKDPISSLARELVQNSIDARKDLNQAVVVEFSSFEIDSDDIPGKDRIVDELDSCIVEWADHKKIHGQLVKMKDAIKKPQTTCLRVSDFNTKGLLGVSGTEKKAFYLLTKGSGISNKEGTAGGSKGIGKYATFVASAFNMVFYSTVTADCEVGYQGICKLCSAPLNGTEEKTQGIGYYGMDEKNQPIQEQFSLEKGFSRTKDNTGTDVYIMGFRKEQMWMKDVITKILDSFIVAIAFRELEVIVQDIKINADTLSSIVYSDEYILRQSKKSIVAQYELLTHSEAIRTIIEIEGLGKAKLYLRGYQRENIEMATHDCVMIRYPYMKIKNLNRVSTIPCSAMCIIENNKLNELLRDIENPQHTDWEVKRILDESKRAEMKDIIRNLQKLILNKIEEHLLVDNVAESEFEGASEYLPNMSETGEGTKKETKTIEEPIVLKPKVNRIIEKSGTVENEHGLSNQPDIGTLTEGETSPLPTGSNEGKDGVPHDSPETGAKKDGEGDILTRQPLIGIQYRFFVVDKSKGHYVVSFTSPYDESDCEMSVRLIDDSGGKSKINIIGCKMNGISCEVKDNTIVGISLFKDRPARFELYTDLSRLFACEVNLYAYR